MSPRVVIPGLLAAALLLAGCEKGWRTDMWYQPSHRPGESPRPEPANSVRLGAPPPLASRDDADSLANPLAGDPASLQHGRFLFGQRCAPCHGTSGHGGGPVSKFFPPAPDLAYATVRARSDGYIFGTITFGGKAMPPQAEGLTVRDRWDLVNAIRSIQAGPPEAKP